MSKDVPDVLDDTSWIAVKGGSVEAIAKVLDLSDPKPAIWAQGMEVVGGNHDDCPVEWGELAGVYITPLVRGWRLAVGHYVGAAPLHRSEHDLRTDWRKVAGWCRRLSRQFGDAQAFTDQAQMDWYSWILARDGAVVRQFVFEDGEFLSDRGPRSEVENRLITRFRPDECTPRWRPDVGDVPKVAGGWSVNPWRIGPRTRLVGQGFVAVTPWGRRHEVVFADLM